MTCWSFLSALSLSLCTLAVVLWGRGAEVAAPIAFLLAYAAPYAVAEGPLPEGVISLIILHAAFSVGFYEVGGDAFGDIIGHSYAVLTCLGVFAAAGVLSVQTGMGFSNTYWNYLALMNHAQNWTVVIVLTMRASGKS